MVEESPVTSQETMNPKEYNLETASVVYSGKEIEAHGLLCRAKDYIYPDEKAVERKEKKPLSHKDKLCGYVQTSGQLGGALGLVASGILEGNFARIGLGGFNASRSAIKLVSDFNAKSRACSHRNDLVEGGVATSANSIGFLNVRSPEELLAVTMGVTAWATKAVTSFIHMRKEKDLDEQKEEQEQNNLFFYKNKVTPKEDAPEPKVMGFIHRNLDKLKDKALEGTLFVMSHAPPLMMGTRAVSYLMDGINNGDMAMAGGGASFIVGATLMAFKDHGSYMKARADRKAEKSEHETLKDKMHDDFDNAEYGAPLTAQLRVNHDGTSSVAWNSELEDVDYSAFVNLENKTYNTFNIAKENPTNV